MGSQTEVEPILRTEAERARICCDAAHHEYRKVLAELHHENVSSDEVDRLEHASRVEMAARQEFWTAFSRLDAICPNGTVPEDLRALSERQRDEADCAPQCRKLITSQTRFSSAEALLKA